VRQLLRRAASHWKLKLAALALSILLWVVFTAEQITSQWIPVRVEPVVRDPAWALAGPPEPARVRVRFRGPGREIWELALRPPTLVLPVRDVGAARNFAVEASMVEMSERFRVVATDVRPGVIRLDLQPASSPASAARPR